jgi:hypothetical protein
MPHIERVLEVDSSGRDDACAPALRRAQNEAHLGTAAWSCVAPPDGQLPEYPTPLQRMLYTRMVTSEFIFKMATFHAERRRTGAVSLPRDIESAPQTLRAGAQPGSMPLNHHRGGAGTR